MTNEEFKQIQTDNGLTNKAMAVLLNTSQRNVENWRQGRVGISGPVAKLIRLLLTK